MGELVGMLANAGLDLLGSFINAGKEKAKQYIEKKTGIKLDDPKKLTPEDIQKLKEFQEKEREMIELVLQDKANARAMQVEALKQDSWFAKNFINLFALFWSIVASVYIYFVTFTSFPVQNQRFADTTLGFVLGTIIASIIGFFYGSSLGSKIKDERILNDK